MKEDILDKYALDQLSLEDKQWIKDTLTEDPSFQQELDLHKKMVKGLVDKATQEEYNKLLKAKISQIDEILDQEGFFDKGLDKALIYGLQQQGQRELSQKIKTVDKDLEQEGFFKAQNSSKTGQFFRIFAAAASIVFILSLTWYFSNDSSINYQQEYASAFKSYENTLSKTVQLELSEQGFGGNPDETKLQNILKAMDAYDQQDYASAIDLFKVALEGKISPEYKKQIQFYLGLCYLELDQPKQSVEYLQPIANTSNETTSWYLALAYLKIEKKEAAKNVLQKLVHPNPYQEQAKKLLQKLS